jgi:hypothetical protein
VEILSLFSICDSTNGKTVFGLCSLMLANLYSRVVFEYLGGGGGGGGRASHILRSHRSFYRLIDYWVLSWRNRLVVQTSNEVNLNNRESLGLLVTLPWHVIKLRYRLAWISAAHLVSDCWIKKAVMSVLLMRVFLLHYLMKTKGKWLWAQTIHYAAIERLHSFPREQLNKSHGGMLVFWTKESN